MPVPQLSTPFGDGILSAAEAAGPQTIGGSTGLAAGQIGSVVVSLNNGTPVAATVNPDGSWSLALDGATLQALPDGTLPVTVTVTDIAGNEVTGTGSFDVLINNLPQANVNPPFVDGVINFNDTQSDQLLTGNTGVRGSGQTVTLTLGGQTYTGTVTENGDWTVTVPRGDLAALPNNSTVDFSVTVADRAGNSATSDPATTPPIAVHTSLPVPTVTNPFGDGIVNINEAASEVTLTGSTGLSGPDQYVTVKIDIDGITYTAVSDDNGIWALTLPAGTLQSLSAGTHQITVYAEDQYGNSATGTQEYIVALTPPAVTITSPIFGDGLVGIAEAANGTELRGTFSSSYPAGATVRVTIGDQTFDATVNGTQWTLAMSGSDWATVTARGQQSVVVSVLDGAGNSNTTAAPVTLLLDAPTVSVTLPFAVDNVLEYAESLTSQTIAGTSTNLQPGDTISVTFNGSTSFTTTVQTDGSWSLQLTPEQMANLPAGPITVTGVDRAGNTGTADNGGNLTIDLTPPAPEQTVVYMDLVAGDNYVNSGEFVDGNLRLTGEVLNLNGGTLTVTANGTTFGSPVINPDGSWYLDIPRASLLNGDYTFIVTATFPDGSGLPEVSDTQQVVVDTVAPTLTINTFTSDNLVNGDEIGTAQTISGVSNAIGSLVNVELNGTTYYAVVQADGNWSVDVPQTDMAALSFGNYTITATISDAAGNQSVASGTFTVDATDPLLQVDTLSLPAVLNTVSAVGGLAVQGQGEPGNTVTIQIGPLSWTGNVDANGNWSYTFPQLDLTTLTDGPQVINISTTDSAGNVSSNSVSLNVALNQGLGVVIDQVFNDGILNVAESLVTQLVTGHITGDYRGANVSLTVVGADFTINDLAIGADGAYSFSLPPSIWAGLLTNTVQLRVDVVDANGNTTYQTVDVGLALTDLPVVGDVLVAGDNVINLAESQLDQTISGTVSNAADVTSVIVNFGGQAIRATVDALGNWTASLPGGVLATLPDGTVNVGVAVTDRFGNVVDSSASFNVVSHNLPGISLDPLFGDGVLSIPELANALISGTATNLAGRTLTIQIGDAPAFTTNVDNSGRWAVNLPDAVKSLLQNLVGSGTESVTVSATDQYGNVATQTGSINVDLLAPVISNVVSFGDNLLNLADSLLNQTITGTTINAPQGSTVQVSLGGQVFNGVVGANGTFSIGLSPALLGTLTDGTFTPQITVTTPDGNVATSTGPAVTIGLKNLPTVAVTTLFGNDGYLNHAEALAAQTISGTVTGLTSGKVTVTVGGQTYQADIVNGSWSLPLSAGTLAQIADGALNVTASVTDAVGNVASGSTVVNAIVQAVPSIGLNTLFGNGVLDLNDLLTNPILSGTSSNLAVGTQILVKVGALSFTTTVGANGAWQLAIPALSLQGLQDGTNVLQVSATATDVAGNVANITQNASVAIQAAPSVLITSLFGDGGLNLADIASVQTISGTSQNAVGSQLTVSIGGRNYTTTVGANGGWSVSLQPAELAALADGSQAVSVSVTNAAGNVANITSAVPVITHNLPTVSLTSLFGNDGYLNISEALNGQIIGGKIGGVVSGAKVVVTVGGAQINATVDANGNWSAALDKSLLQGLTTGSTKIGVSVTDQVGNTTATSTDVLVKFTQPTLSTNPITNLLGIIGGVLTGLLGSAKLTISGSSTNLEQGSIVHLNLLNLAGATAIVGADGRWSADLTVGLDLAKILSLSTVVNLYAADSAGNLAYLNVGLNGSNPNTNPPTTTLMVAEAESFSVLAASALESSDSQESSSSHTAAATTTSESTETSDTATDSAFTIGGLSIDLADGTTQSGESVQGGAGNDTIHLSTLGFTSIDGGAGTDTLALDGVNLVLNLINGVSQIHNIEIIDLGQSGTNSVTLDVHEALTLTDKPEDDLLIKGSNGDQVNLKHGNSDIWSVTGQREVDGVQFDVYHNSGQNDTLADVLIQHGLHVNVV